jgi:peroxiredoxin
MPSLQALHDDLKDRGLEILGVNLGEDREQVQAFVQRKAYTFRVALDPEEAIGAKFGVRAIPTLVVVDKRGAVRWIHVGAAAGEDELKKLLDRLTRE